MRVALYFVIIGMGWWSLGFWLVVIGVKWFDGGHCCVVGCWRLIWFQCHYLVGWLVMLWWLFHLFGDWLGDVGWWSWYWIEIVMVVIVYWVLMGGYVICCDFLGCICLMRVLWSRECCDFERFVRFGWFTVFVLIKVMRWLLLSGCDSWFLSWCCKLWFLGWVWWCFGVICLWSGLGVVSGLRICSGVDTLGVCSLCSYLIGVLGLTGW